MHAKTLRRALLALSSGLLILTNSGMASANGSVVPPQGGLLTRIYSGLSAGWWKHFIELPIAEDGSHPYFDQTGDLVAFGQHGALWYVAAPLTLPAPGPIERAYSVPRQTWLFFALPVVECSSLEPDPFFGGTPREQRRCAKFWADFIQDVFFELDGVPIENIARHRIASPQFRFVAPDANILFVPGGVGGTAVSDGYFVLLNPLSTGSHTLHFGGMYIGTPFGDFGSEITDHLTVE